MITVKSDNIKVEGHVGTWYVIDETERSGKKLFLLEHETYGDEAACVIVDEDGNLELEDVWNGFDDYDEANDYNTDLLTEDDMWTILSEHIGVSEETIRCVTDINGYSKDTMEDILYVMTGYRNFEQAQDEYGYDLRTYC